MWRDKEYRIEVRIVSEAIFNSGERERNLVQSKALTDRNGFVYFHAKTLKGQLKRQAFWLLRQYQSLDDDAKARSFFHSLAWLFGINKEESEAYGMKDVDHPVSGKMKLSHLELDEQIRHYFIGWQFEDAEKEYFTIPPHNLIEAQTHIRTGIQLEDGVALDKRLTTYHTVKKGLVFYSALSFDDDPADYLKDLLRIVRSFRRIGAGIHRGRGEVEARLLMRDKEGESFVSIQHY